MRQVIEAYSIDGDRRVRVAARLLAQWTGAIRSSFEGSADGRGDEARSRRADAEDSGKRKRGSPFAEFATCDASREISSGEEPRADAALA